MLPGPAWLAPGASPPAAVAPAAAAAPAPQQTLAMGLPDLCDLPPCMRRDVESILGFATPPGPLPNAGPHGLPAEAPGPAFHAPAWLARGASPPPAVAPAAAAAPAPQQALGLQGLDSLPSCMRRGLDSLLGPATPWAPLPAHDAGPGGQAAVSVSPRGAYARPAAGPAHDAGLQRAGPHALAIAAPGATPLVPAQGLDRLAPLGCIAEVSNSSAHLASVNGTSVHGPRDDRTAICHLQLMIINCNTNGSACIRSFLCK